MIVDSMMRKVPYLARICYDVTIRNLCSITFIDDVCEQMETTFSIVLSIANLFQIIQGPILNLKDDL